MVESSALDSDDEWEPIGDRGNAEWKKRMDDKLQAEGSATRFRSHASKQENAEQDANELKQRLKNIEVLGEEDVKIIYTALFLGEIDDETALWYSSGDESGATLGQVVGQT